MLAPMAGVTDAPFRVLCASFGGGLFVNQMVTARALLEGHATSWDLTRFHPAERIRSLQLYGTDPLTLGEAVRRLVAEDRVTIDGMRVLVDGIASPADPTINPLG